MNRERERDRDPDRDPDPDPALANAVPVWGLPTETPHSSASRALGEGKWRSN